MKHIITFTLAGLFSLSASAADLSNLDYEYYAESSVWPTDDHNFFNHSVITSNGNQDLSSLIYEDYAQSAEFPDHESLYQDQGPHNIAAIQERLERDPTAAGSHPPSSGILLHDLFGNDIHTQ